VPLPLPSEGLRVQSALPFAFKVPLLLPSKGICIQSALAFAIDQRAFAIDQRAFAIDQRARGGNILRPRLSGIDW
jgi:hypothetical protein